uniref:Thymosin beta-a n=1 Tax=Salmo salar TaxID=8030 RepID=B9EP28_SALSA|nr:Thymosin beta-a [Salmo salar]
MGDNNPVKQGVETFDKKCLKKTNTAKEDQGGYRAGEES